MRFSTVSTMFPYNFGNLPNSAHVYSNSMIQDSVNWTQIKGSFIADSAYQFIVIGNFFDSTNTSQVGNGAMYFLDDVCVSTDSTTCYSKEPYRFLGKDTVLCEGQSLVLHAPAQNSTYTWQDNSTSPSYTVSQQGTYWVKVSNNCNDMRDTIHVSYKTFPRFKLGNDTLICKNDTLPITLPAGNYTYLWQDHSTVPRYFIREEGIYWVRISDGACSVADSIAIKTKACEIPVIVPNVFTPNGDGINEIFCIKNAKLLNDLSLRIFNRWGESVFESSEADPAWEGQSHGTNCPAGTYFWVVSYLNSGNEPVTLHGFMTLFR